MQSAAPAEPERKGFLAEGTAFAKAWRPEAQERILRLRERGSAERGRSWGDGQVRDPVKPGISHVTSAGGRLGGPGLCKRRITTYYLGGVGVRRLGPGLGPELEDRDGAETIQ